MGAASDLEGIRAFTRRIGHFSKMGFEGAAGFFDHSVSLSDEQSAAIADEEIYLLIGLCESLETLCGGLLIVRLDVAFEEGGPDDIVLIPESEDVLLGSVGQLEIQGSAVRSASLARFSTGPDVLFYGYRNWVNQYEVPGEQNGLLQDHDSNETPNWLEYAKTFEEDPFYGPVVEKRLRVQSEGNILHEFPYVNNPELILRTLLESSEDFERWDEVDVEQFIENGPRLLIYRVLPETAQCFRLRIQSGTGPCWPTLT
jgi:hypothetical protein